jgi:hypothetical protein
MVIFNRRRTYDVADELRQRATIAAEVHPGSHHAPWVAATIVRTGI